MAVDSIPQARVVRKGGRLMAQPPAPRGAEASPLLTALGYALGLWPLTCVVMLVLGLLVLAGNNGAP
ncbi:MAG TPA: hypothetical protein VFT22_23405 [Kofleriaceae bacterium]|nr:hypothetical protein [Kofleriaceae bacterium]